MDNGALPFESHKDIIKGTLICINIIEKFGLTVHTGLGEKKSKTKAIFISSTSKLK